MLPMFHSAYSQERIQYFTQKGKPCVADSAQEIRKGQLQQDGKWHVFKYSKTGALPTGEAFYQDTAFLVPDGECIEYRNYTDKKIRSRGWYQQGQKTGDWSYYTKEGILCSVETMNADTITSAMDYDDAGKNPTPHVGPYEKDSEYPGGSAAWMKYLNNIMAHAKLPRAFTQGYVWGTVIVQFIIDEKGIPTDIQVVRSVHPDLDKLVCDAIQNSKGWSVAWQHNRPVKSYKKQPISFKLTAR